MSTKVYVQDESFTDFGAIAARTTYAVKGKGIVVAVLDTGIDPTHEQLDRIGKVIAWADFTGTPSLTPVDPHGHGTHVASIVAGDGRGPSGIAGRYRGVAPATKLVVVRVLDGTGSGTIEDVIAGVQYAMRLPEVDIITMSLGTHAASDGSDPLSQAVNEAVTVYGKTVTVAAGNLGSDYNTIGSPGAAEFAITVGASSAWSTPPEQRASASGVYPPGLYLAPWSSRGDPDAAVSAPNRLKPDITAPGVRMMAAAAGAYAASSASRYIALSGTSMATPYVAGTVALMLGRNSSLTPQNVKDILSANAYDLGLPGKDADWGAGLIDSLAAVAGVTGDPAATPFPAHQQFVAYHDTAVYPFWDQRVDVGDDASWVSATVLFGPASVDEQYPSDDWRMAAMLRSIQTNGVLDVSFCPNDWPCGWGAHGHQETLGSATFGPGYLISVIPERYAAGFEGRTGTILVDVFYG
jgi:serine protease AprX